MKSRFEQVVFDTNVLLSAILLPQSKSGDAYLYALEWDILLASKSTLVELQEVLSRTKFDRYITPHARRRFFEIYERRSVLCAISHTVVECRDPKDNKFLELALSGNADRIVTGDKDLLILHPWRGISISTPAMYRGSWA